MNTRIGTHAGLIQICGTESSIWETSCVEALLSMRVCVLKHVHCVESLAFRISVSLITVSSVYFQLFFFLSHWLLRFIFIGDEKQLKCFGVRSWRQRMADTSITHPHKFFFFLSENIRCRFSLLHVKKARVHA